MSLLKVDQDSAHIKFPPPFILLLGILSGGLIQWLWPIRILPENLRGPFGALFVVIGIGVIVSCSRLFKKVQTSIEPWKTTSHIVTTGVYRVSRNPIYLSFILVGLGTAFLINSAWIALTQVFVVILIQKFVIAKEEHYLESKFGDEYRRYKARVRRWI